MNAVRWIGWLLAASLAMGCTRDEGICDPETLESALFGAYQGDTVQIGICRVKGSFTVPEGVTLAGAGPDASYLASGGAEAVVTVRPSSGAATTRLVGLAVESTGVAGVLAEGHGAVDLEDVWVRVERGIGIGVEDVDTLTLSGADLLGPVSSRNAATIPPVVTPATIATHGLVLVDVEAADLSDVRVAGFAMMGVTFVQASTTWRGGGSSENRGVGLIVHGGTAVLADLTLCGGLQGLSLPPAYGAMFVAGAEVETQGLTVCENEGIGLFHDSARGVHLELSLTDNAEAAVWGQREGTAIELSGFTMAGNSLGGVVAHEMGALIARDGEIDATALASRVFGESSPVTAGDGVQIVRPRAATLLQDLVLRDNERVGVLLQLEGAAPADVTLAAIRVEGSGDRFGALAQGEGAAIPEAWDADVARTPELEENDREQMEVGTPLRLVSNLEGADVPVATELASEGLVWLLGWRD